MSYILFPHVRVQAANMFGSSFLIGGPPVFAAYGLGEAMCHRLGGGARVTGMLFIHHDREALGEFHYHHEVLGQAVDFFYLQQRRGAAFTFVNGSDYSSKNKHALSLQPVACAHLRVSIIWELENVYAPKEAEDFLRHSRLAGGLVTGHGAIAFTDSLSEAVARVGGGYVVMDRRDLLEKRDKNQAEYFVEALGAMPVSEEEDTWLSAACLGYAAITPFAGRGGAREGYKHAFAEPLVGMVQYRSLRQWLEKDGMDLEDALWRPIWLEDKMGAFVLQQDRPDEQ